MDLSIIILSHNSKNDLQKLLPSIFSSKIQYSYEIILVDNGSMDDTWAWLVNEKEGGFLKAKNIQLISNFNAGFAAGNNLGIKKSTGDYILLLNPDTLLMADTLQSMVDFMRKNPKVGMATCKIIKADGTLDRAARRNFPNPINSLLRFVHLQNFSKKPYNFSDESANQEMEIESLVGAFCLTKRLVINKIGLLDESFFMYGEDLDWCFRAKQAGFLIWYTPRTYIIHNKGSASSKRPFKALRWFHDAMWLFYKKHYSKKYFVLLNFLVFVGIYARFIFLVIILLFKKQKFVSK